MDYRAIEEKWQKYWEENNIYKFNKSRVDKKYYMLEMFAYPSGANLHIGHWYNYGPSDSFARFKRMQGYEVFQPMGFDAFGLPAENYAIKTGIHPKDSTYKNIATMQKQLHQMGTSFDWSAQLNTCDPEYYRWTQWLFLQFYKNGLVYQKEAPVNWCNSCNTVIANEQVVDGQCERCHTVIERKYMRQWFFRITKYAEELLEGLDKLDWPEKTKLMQKNWIGKSVGGEIEFEVETNGKATGKNFRVFTTRADTLPGLSFVVLAPEHPLVDEITTEAQREAVDAYKAETARTSDIERLSTSKEKSGVFVGSYAISPLDNRRVPIFIADYVLYTYGTGAVMGVPAHDERDFAFAKKYNLDIISVINTPENQKPELPYTEYGIMSGNPLFEGFTSEEGKVKVIEHLAKSGKGELKTNYRLRDWSISRQRFWGCPIPIIHCSKCGNIPVPDEQLPVELPYDVNFTPDGQSPLRNHSGYMNVKCPVCGGDAQRDPDTLDTFVCSSWYYLRFPDARNDKEAFNSEWINKVLPVDKYVGGAEHACMHLLYARFFTKALRDMGLLNFDEPFLSLVHQGLILGSDGEKMSKSKGNIVNPDSYVSQFGSDNFRLYLMFGFSYFDGGPWNDDGIAALVRFTERIDRLVSKIENATKSESFIYGQAEKELDYALHYAIQQVTKDMEVFGFNTALARIMELLNSISKYDSLQNSDSGFAKEVLHTMIKLLAPFAPHFCEEWNERLGGKPSIFSQSYPVCDPAKLIKDEVELAVQVNGKVRSKIVVSTSASQEEIKQAAINDEKIAEILGGKEPSKVIVIPKRLVNIVM